MHIQFLKPKFDLNGFYMREIKKALYHGLDSRARELKLKTLVQRAYEQGVEDGKRDDTYFDKD